MHSSTSMAMRLRNSIAVGFIRISPSEMVGNSSGKPPALHTPRFTASATWRRWALQVVSSENEFAIPTTGRPSNTASEKPSLLVHERLAKPSRSFRPNQLRLRSSRVVIGASVLGGKHNTNPGVAGVGGDPSRGADVTAPERDGAAAVTETREARFARARARRGRFYA